MAGGVERKREVWREWRERSVERSEEGRVEREKCGVGRQEWGGTGGDSNEEW